MTPAPFSDIYHTVLFQSFLNQEKKTEFMRITGDGGADNFIQLGWQPWYSGSGGYNTAGGNDADGQSLHITSMHGASVGLEFSGTYILLPKTPCKFDRPHRNCDLLIWICERLI